MAAYYNEIDPYAAQWLRNLISAGHIAPGDVDERSIEDVCADDIKNYTQCHFFAGIGGWSRALRNAGWTDERAAWTASCPCQPFSTAGKTDGFDDERHLWPALQWLICQRQPGILFGEQVASKTASDWIDLVQDDLEALGYAFGAVAFPSAGIGAPHIRDRCYWVGESASLGRERKRQKSEHRESLQTSENACAWAAANWTRCNDGRTRPFEPGAFPLANGVPQRVGRLRAYGNAINVEAAAQFIKAYLES